MKPRMYEKIIVFDYSEHCSHAFSTSLQERDAKKE